MELNIYRFLIFASIIFSASTGTVSAEDTQTGRPGAKISLRCSFNNVSTNGIRVIWQKCLEDGLSLVIADLFSCSGNDVTTCQSAIQNSPKYFVDGTLTRGVNLVIRALTLADDGSYECKVVSSDGLMKRSVRLFVISVPDAIELFDVENGSSVKDGTLYIVIGRRHMLNCSVPTPSNPPPDITWTSGDVNIEPQDQMNQNVGDSLLVTSFRQVLVIGQEGDTGKVVTCSAQHPGLAAPLQATVTLKTGGVPDAIDLLDVENSSSVKDGTLYIVIGRRHMLNCSVPTPSYPPPDITWTSGDVNIESQGQLNLTVGDSLLVTSFRQAFVIGQEGDTGKVVTCSAQHPELPAPLQATVTLEAGDLPGNPEYILVVEAAITTDSITVSWLQGNSGCKSQTFTVSYCPIDKRAECREEGGIRHTFYTLQNLQPFSIYNITVKSHTVFGFSKNNGHIQAATQTLPVSAKGSYYITICISIAAGTVITMIVISVCMRRKHLSFTSTRGIKMSHRINLKRRPNIQSLAEGKDEKPTNKSQYDPDHYLEILDQATQSSPIYSSRLYATSEITPPFPDAPKDLSADLSAGSRNITGRFKITQKETEEDGCYESY